MIAILFGLLMGVVHYFSETILDKFKSHKWKLISFSAGISITYLFLNLFPRFVSSVSKENKFLFLSILFGFVIFHVIEKYIYKQKLSEYKRLKEVAIEDSTISFIYHFIIGMMIVSFFNQSFFEGMLFFIPVLLYTSVDTIPVDRTNSKIAKAILSFSTLLGILFSTFFYKNMGNMVYLVLLGFIIGALTFTVTRHSIPDGKKGSPLFFIFGVIIYSIIIFLL
jgi:hypothetical protein